ncbi:putative multidrug resistance ABC transporter ATP-binding/permease protein YheI [Paenibacillus solanacearum]|uniref:Multidrug resistance ABC transporter ATP-binding/permease protein YheI n=1 Tax=Paenibacillus solanacearum TaxID=2048548 RepID=A0A916JT57_9BACL|nr:ABC transporter ATP-binding protein [Paenibacillus solanacearum]CAG7599074.1 putative multidrug resistance ABC transporter ATP-binding/permease protein YheI [Paenibacillus solanacearum]
MRELWTLKEFLWRFRYRYAIGIASILITDVCQLCIPWVLGRFTDDVKDGSIASSQLWTYIGYLLLASAGIFVFRYMWRVMIFGAARTLEYEMRNRLFAHYQKLPVSWYNRHKTGDLMALATNDLQALRFSFGGGVVTAFDSLILLSTAIVMMTITVDWRLTLVGLLPLPVMLVVALRFGSQIHERFRDAQQAFAGLTDRVQENISGMRVVKAFAQEESEVRKFASMNNHNFERNMSVARIQALFNPLVQWITGVSLLLVLGYGGILVVQERITLGEFVTFNAYMGLLTGPIMAIGWMINIFQRGAASMSRINEILNTRGDIADDADRLKPISRLTGSIRIADLSFRYPGADADALRKINLDIEQGQTVAIIGRTGSGKSTLVNLLVRLYDCKEGSIRIDGHALREIPLAVLRRDIGFVPQENFLFSETIRDNIAFGTDSVPFEKVRNAADEAQVLDNIVEFPNQFETMLGERGVTLSGGQKQRISIARAMIKDPAILILDDSLSAVDTKTEEAILTRLKRNRRGKTTIMIAHRVSTVQHADQILVMEDGAIVERGTHEQLLALGGPYRNLYEKQLLEEQVAGES